MKRRNTPITRKKKCLSYLPSTSWMKTESWSSPGLCSQTASRWAELPSSDSTARWEAESENAPAGPAVARHKQPVMCTTCRNSLTNYLEADVYLDALDEVPHWEVMVEEDADQHLRHFSVEFKRKAVRQDQLREKKNIYMFFIIVAMALSKEDFWYFRCFWDLKDTRLCYYTHKWGGRRKLFQNSLSLQLTLPTKGCRGT